MVPARVEAIASLFSEGVEDEPVGFAERRRRRVALLRERFGERVRRAGAGLTYVAAPRRLPALAAAMDLLIRDRAVATLEAPPPDRALERPDGLCGLARCVAPASVIEGYSAGLALFAPMGAPTWWSPSRRWVMAPGALRAEAAGLRRRLGKAGLSAQGDIGFDRLVAACARPNARAERLGFGPALMGAWFDLFDAGLAHGIVLHFDDGRIAAGVFGLAIGRVFMSEGAFGPPDLLRAALVLLDAHLAQSGFALHDARLGWAPYSPPRADVGPLGFEPLPRESFLRGLRANLCGGGVLRWRIQDEPAPDETVPARKPPPAREVAREFASAA